MLIDFLSNFKNTLETCIELMIIKRRTAGENFSNWYVLEHFINFLSIFNFFFRLLDFSLNFFPSHTYPGKFAFLTQNCPHLAPLHTWSQLQKCLSLKTGWKHYTIIELNFIKFYLTMIKTSILPLKWHYSH